MTKFGACCEHCGKTYETQTWCPSWRCAHCYEGTKQVWVFTPVRRLSGLTKTADQIMGRSA